MKTYLTVDEVARRYRVKRQTIYKWICEKKIPSITVGGRTLFDEDELNEWALSGRRETIRESL